MSGMWRGVMFVGVLVAGQHAGLAAAAPLLPAADALQPTPAPTPAVPPRPAMRVQREPQEREAERRAAREEAQARREEVQARREAERGPWAADQPPIIRTFKGGQGITLDLLNMSGDVVVIGGKGPDGKLTVVRRVRGAGAEAERLLRELDVDVAEHANRIAVRTKLPMLRNPREAKDRVRTDYEIALPAGTALELKNLQGNVRVVNVAGDVRVDAYAGDVVAEALSRVRMLRSMSGDVMLSRSVVDGDANLQTVSGNVIAQAVKATSLTLGSVSGTVQVKESSAARALVRTVSGDIEFAAAPRKAGRYELRTHAGDIFVFAPGGQGFEFEASTFKGDVRADIPTRPVSPGVHQVRGSVGDGSAFFDLTSFTGDIRIVKAEHKEK